MVVRDQVNRPSTKEPEAHASGACLLLCSQQFCFFSGRVLDEIALFVLVFPRLIWIQQSIEIDLIVLSFV